MSRKMMGNLLAEEQQRSARYFERMTRVEGNLARIRVKLGVTNRPNEITLERIDDLLDMACRWVEYTDSFAVKRFDQEGELNDADTN